MIFTCIKYLVIGLVCIPPMLLFILLIPTTYRIYWSGQAVYYANVHPGFAYFNKRRTVLWILSVYSLNNGLPSIYARDQVDKGKVIDWQRYRTEWLNAKGFKKECSWVPAYQLKLDKNGCWEPHLIDN